MLRFILTSKIKPYTRMTRRGKFSSPSAQEYLANQEDLKWQLQQQMVENGWQIFRSKTPLAIELSISEVLIHNHDLDNTEKAILDAASKIVYPDDRWIDEIRVRRYKSDEHKSILLIWELRSND